MLILIALAAFAVGIGLVIFFWPDHGRRWGRFEGRVVTDWHQDGRNMTLLEDFAYIDPLDKRWLAPKGSHINGASIPIPFWSIIGGPFEGKYRNASVVHDVACDERTEPWADVHLAFYHACRCGGVEERKAKLMYYAVYHFGPRWQVGVKGYRPSAGAGESFPGSPSPVDTITPEDVQKALAFFDANNPSIEEISSLKIR
ncbi:MAG: DUF1353 domain-containing protein [Planctomycetota bacterium]